MALIATNPFAVKYGSGVVLIGDTYTPPVDPPPYRARAATDDPMPSDFYMNVPVGSGMTYVSTSDPRHTTMTGATFGLNYNNWTDPVYTVNATDPLSAGIEHRTVLPAGYKEVPNTGAVTGTAGPIRKKYTSPDFRVPTNATWQSTTNTDRKVMLDFMYDITLTTTTYATDGVTVTGTSTRFYPAGTLRIEAHNWSRVSGSTVIYCTNLSKQNIYLGDTGYTEGAVASGIFMSGYARAWEVAAAKAGDMTAIKHALKSGIPDSMLKSGPLWPARTEDAPNPPYTGSIPYGSHLVLLPSYDIEAATSDPLARAFLWTMKHYGTYILIRSSSFTFGIEPRGAGYSLTSTEVNTVKAALMAAKSSMRWSANSNLTPGTGAFNYNSTTRQPVRGAQDIAGGGTRLTAGQGLTDIDNTTGLKLPLDPALYT